MGPDRRPLALAGALCALTLTACAGTVHHGGKRAGAVRVIQAWASALRHGRVARAAAYFALPSVFFNGPGPSGAPLVIRIRTRAQALAVNASLPCGATLISTSARGPYIVAVFRLGARPGPGGSACEPGAGQIARVEFRIVDGRIASWLRAPAAAPPPPVPAGPVPGTAPSPPPTTSTGAQVV
jgi:hypothetical protein